jgi:hypothetical protein
MKRKERLFFWGTVIAGIVSGVVGCSGGQEFVSDTSSSNLSVHLARKKGGGTPPSLLGTWEGKWTSSIPSGGTSPDSGTVHLVVTQQSGGTFQADITVYDPSRGESISDRIDNGKIKGNKVSFKGKRSFERDGQAMTLNVNFSGTVTGTQASGTYSGTLVKGSGRGKGNKSEQDQGTWTLTKS